jgi:hypothetical protein
MGYSKLKNPIIVMGLMLPRLEMTLTDPKDY